MAVAQVAAADLAYELGISLEEAAELAAWADAPAESSESTSRSDVHESLSGEETEEIAFLVASFPSISLGVIKSKLMDAQNDLERATDLLLNYELTKAETGQFLDKQTSRKARSQAKRQKKLAKGSIKEAHDVKQLSEVTGMATDEATRFYRSCGSSLSHSFAWFYKSEPAQSHILELAETKPFSSTKSSAIGNEDLLGGRTITLRNINEAKRQYEEIHASAIERSKRYAALTGESRMHSAPLITEARNEASRAFEKIKELDLFQRRVANYHPNSDLVDFHNMPLRAAMAVCEDKVEDWLHSTNPQLKLVTGAGRHSAEGVAKIRQAVAGYLETNRIRFEEDGDGAFILRR